MLISTDYLYAKNITLSPGQTMELTSPNYPKSTYADSRWLIVSNREAVSTSNHSEGSTSNHTEESTYLNHTAGAYVLTFIDFNVTFGVTLTIGSGNDFSVSSNLFKIGTKDIPINTNDTIIIKEPIAWIWLRANDPETRSQEQSVIDNNLKFDVSPIISGVKLQIDNTGKGTNSYVMFYVAQN